MRSPRGRRRSPRRFDQRRHQLFLNRGTFWKADEVEWGPASVNIPGRLVGYRKNAKKGPHPDFWDQRGVYALYAQWQVVYVGQAYAGGIGERLKRHRGDAIADRWDRFSWFGMRQVLADGTLKPLKQVKTGSVGTALNQLEALLIDVAEPRLNGQGGTWNKKSGVELYVQDRLARNDRNADRAAVKDAE